MVTISGLHNIQDVTGDALNLFKKADKADPDLKTAVVAWQGYESPGFVDVAFQGKAEAGAKLLAADVNAIGVTHVGLVPNLTVVGHSYGSTTTSLALQREGMVVNQAVLIGSPGGGGQAKSVADLGRDKSRVFVGSASTDAVTIYPDSLGEDPTEAVFGATRIKAEPLERGTGPNWPDHSLYYSAGSESLYALAAIVTGQGERLGSEGMLAEPRHMGKVTTSEGLLVDGLVDPEAGRTQQVVTNTPNQEGPAHELIAHAGRCPDRHDAAIQRHSLPGQYTRPSRGCSEDKVRADAAPAR